MHNEKIDDTKEYEIFDPNHTWKRKTVTDFYAKSLLVKIFDKGKQVYFPPALKEIRTHCEKEVETLWDEVTRFENPHTYYVDLSKKLWHLREKLLNKSN